MKKKQPTFFFRFGVLLWVFFAWVPVTFSAPSLCPTGMILIPKGSYFRGDSNLLLDQRPLQKIHLSSFCVDAREVTLEDYQKCVGQKKCKALKQSLRGFHLKRPAVFVTWFQARDYCRLHKKRLPSEAEWEKVAKGKTGKADYGVHGAMNCKKANYGALKSYSCRKGHSLQSKPVGSYAPNSWGVYDLSGNVAEWVEDCYSPSFYKRSSSNNPLNTDCKKEEARVARGGSFASPLSDIRSTFRLAVHPQSVFSDVGFRCVFSNGRD